METCQEPASEQVMVSVQHAFGGSGTLASIDDAGVVQHAELDEIPSGPIRVTVQAPDGYGGPVVFCSDAEAGAGEAQPVPLADGTSFEWDYRADRVLECLVFNIPAPGDPAVADDSNQFTVMSYTCPEGTSITLGLDELLEACAPSGGRESVLAHDGGGTQPPMLPVDRRSTGVPEGAGRYVRGAGLAFDDVFCGRATRRSRPSRSHRRRIRWDALRDGAAHRLQVFIRRSVVQRLRQVTTSPTIANLPL